MRTSAASSKKKKERDQTPGYVSEGISRRVTISRDRARSRGILARWRSNIRGIGGIVAAWATCQTNICEVKGQRRGMQCKSLSLEKVASVLPDDDAGTPRPAWVDRSTRIFSTRQSHTGVAILLDERNDEI